MAGYGVIGSEEVRSAEGHFTLFRELKKHKSRTAHTRGAVLELRRRQNVNRNQDETSVTSDLQTFTVDDAQESAASLLVCVQVQ